MIDSKILASIIIVACIGVAAAGYQMTQTEAPLWDPSSTQDAQPDDSSQSQDDSQNDAQTDLDPQQSGSDTNSKTSDSGNGKTSSNNGNSGNGNSGSNSGANSNSNSNSGTKHSESNTKKQSSESGGISSSQAKSIANSHIEAEGAYAGSAKKTTLSGEPVYYVPILKEGKVVGDFYINMKGKVIEASGGA